jgi:hypothetical protein
MLGVVCIWEPEGDDPEHLQVSVAWVPVPSGTDVGQVCEAGLPGIPNAKPFPDAGLGNSAYWDYSTAALASSGSLHVCADGGILDTAAIGARPEAELKEIAVSLARTALSRV